MNDLHPAHPDRHDHDQGLAHDLDVLARTLQRRRRTLAWLGGAGALALFGGAALAAPGRPGTAPTRPGGSTGSGGTTTTSGCSLIPEETAGPYPGDGSNTANGSVANALMLSGIVRSDIRSSFAGLSGTAAGVPLTVVLELVNTNGSCADLSGYAIYLWHCDRDGKYSMYSSGVTNQNYLRGVQQTGSDGKVTFTTIFPACYSGRMPHIHFEVYRSTNTATSYTNKLRTSQLALPTDVCKTVYAGADGYAASVANLNQISFATDNVFSDGVTTQLATVGGSLSAGYTAALTVGIAV